MQTLQEYKCPCCGGAIAFDSTLQKMKCPYCDTEFEMEALEGYDAFSCAYRDGAFRSRAASPVLYQNRIIGAVYAYEYDTEQAALLEGLQSNLLKLSAGIAAAVVLGVFFYAEYLRKPYCYIDGVAIYDRRLPCRRRFTCRDSRISAIRSAWWMN